MRDRVIKMVHKDGVSKGATAWILKLSLKEVDAYLEGYDVSANHILLFPNQTAKLYVEGVVTIVSSSHILFDDIVDAAVHGDWDIALSLADIDVEG